MPVSKKRTKKQKKTSTSNTRALFRRDTRRTMRTMIAALERVTLMREECEKIKGYPVDVIKACEASEREILKSIEGVEGKANVIIERCDPTVAMSDWEENDQLDVASLSLELETESEVIINKCVEAGASLQI